MLKLETIADLDQLIKDEIQESLTLDYKVSASLGRSNDQRKELVKDVSHIMQRCDGYAALGVAIA